MTKQETHGIRSNRLSNWIRQNCPDSSTGFQAYDLDFILLNYKTKEVQILEEKLRNANPSFSQRMMLKKLNSWISAGIKQDEEGWTYHGCHLVQFSKEGPEDGSEIRINHKLTTLEQLKKFLSFEIFKKK
jgi:hypothetical protein